MLLLHQHPQLLLRCTLSVVRISLVTKRREFAVQGNDIRIIIITHTHKLLLAKCTKWKKQLFEFCVKLAFAFFQTFLLYLRVRNWSPSCTEKVKSRGKNRGFKRYNKKKSRAIYIYLLIRLHRWVFISDRISCCY